MVGGGDGRFLAAWSRLAGRRGLVEVLTGAPRCCQSHGVARSRRGSSSWLEEAPLPAEALQRSGITGRGGGSAPVDSTDLSVVRRRRRISCSAPAVRMRPCSSPRRLNCWACPVSLVIVERACRRLRRLIAPFADATISWNRSHVQGEPGQDQDSSSPATRTDLRGPQPDCPFILPRVKLPKKVPPPPS